MQHLYNTATIHNNQYSDTISKTRVYIISCEYGDLHVGETKKPLKAQIKTESCMEKNRMKMGTRENLKRERICQRTLCANLEFLETPNPLTTPNGITRHFT